MKEGLRTIVLLILLALAIGFVVWSSKQNTDNIEVQQPGVGLSR